MSAIENTGAAAGNTQLDENGVYTLEDFPELLKAINSDDRARQLFGTIGIRASTMNVDEQMTQKIQKLIDANVVPRLISFTDRLQDSELQNEAAWLLSILTSGTSAQTKCVVEKGGISAFERLLKYENSDKTNPIFGLANIATDKASLRDSILKSTNVLHLIIDLVENSDNEFVISKGIWALANLVKGKPTPSFKLVKDAIPTFSKVLQKTQDPETLSEALWALSLFCEDNEGIESVLETNVCPALVSYIRLDQDVEILRPVIDVVGGILTGNAEHSNGILKIPGVVEKLVELATKHESQSIVRNACWCLSNIAAGTSDLVLKNEEQVNSLIKLFQLSSPVILKEVFWIFSLATQRASPAQTKFLCECNLLGIFIKRFTDEKPENVEVALKGVKNILATGARIAEENNGENLFLKKFEELDGIKVLKGLQMHPDNDISELAFEILKDYCEI